VSSRTDRAADDLGERMKPHFSRFLLAVPGRLHAAAHSHHPWPDVSYAAQQRAWLDAAQHVDRKWDQVIAGPWRGLRRHVARRIRLSDPGTVAIAPNTHELLTRVLSCLDPGARVLTTDAEFHSAARQLRRLEEDGCLAVERVPAEPFDTFPERFAAAAQRGGHALVLLSRVFFDSGYVVPDVPHVVDAVPDERTWVVVDDYHGFMAVPVDWSGLEHRAFYLAGGYKYAMAGEGACFMHCPPDYGERPRYTGWFAAFDDLEESDDTVPVGFPADGDRFLGSTFDPSGLYRFTAVQDWLQEEGVTVAEIHAHVGRAQARFLAGVEHLPGFSPDDLVPGPEIAGRGNFLTFRRPDAPELVAALAEEDVLVDSRGDRLRIGFGLYHEEHDVRTLTQRLTAALRFRS
jgi:kynureninase